MFFSLQSGYIDGPILNTFHTNLVVLPAVMEYMQYGFIALGLATIIIAAVVHYKAKVSLSRCSHAALCYCVFITACCRVMHVVPLTHGRKSRRVNTEPDIKVGSHRIYLRSCFWFNLVLRNVG